MAAYPRFFGYGGFFLFPSFAVQYLYELLSDSAGQNLPQFR